MARGWNGCNEARYGLLVTASTATLSSGRDRVVYMMAGVVVPATGAEETRLTEVSRVQQEPRRHLILIRCRVQCFGKKRRLGRREDKGVFGTALLYVFQLRSTFFSQTVSAPRTQFEKKGWSCEST